MNYLYLDFVNGINFVKTLPNDGVGAINRMVSVSTWFSIFWDFWHILQELAPGLVMLVKELPYILIGSQQVTLTRQEFVMMMISFMRVVNLLIRGN